MNSSLADGSRRASPAAIEVLLPVWSYQFVQQFFDSSLPTLLAPGNIPALCKTLPCRFTLMTSADDVEFLCEHPNFRRLSAACETKVVTIDHLIMEGNYSTTLTLAYAEAVRAAGSAMLDTCFFFLVSDYVMADGSLANVLDHMMKGAAAVQVGNFHAIAEDFSPWLRQQLKSAPDALSLPARELVRQAISQAHPNTVARIVNYPVNHDPYANRLFWRVDENTLVGRFYLMHMLCIRPETANFTIGSSCDYSFVPEMCPSGGVDIVTDSDEYFVVEMQPRDRDLKQLRRGALRPRVLARSLSEWTTARHRENAHTSVIFHSEEVPDQTAERIAEADAFVAAVGGLLKRKPQPHRDHPYWRAAIAALKDAKGHRLQPHEIGLALGTPVFEASPAPLVRRAAFALFGRPPYVRPWHPRWLDYHMINNELQPALANPREQILLISDRPTAFTTALADDGERVTRLRTTPFLKRPADKYVSMHGRFKFCLVELGETEMAAVDLLVSRAVPLMARGGKIMVSVDNRHAFGTALDFGSDPQLQLGQVLRHVAGKGSLRFVHAGWLRYAAWRSLVRIGNLALRHPLIGIPIAAATGWVLALLSLVSTAASAWRIGSGDGIVSSIAIVIQADDGVTE